MHSALMYMLSAIGRGNDQPDKPVEHSRFSDQAVFEPNMGLLLEVPIIDEPKPIHRPHNLVRHEQAGFETTTDASTCRKQVYRNDQFRKVRDSGPIAQPITDDAHEMFQVPEQCVGLRIVAYWGAQHVFCQNHLKVAIASDHGGARLGQLCLPLIMPDQPSVQQDFVDQEERWKIRLVQDFVYSVKLRRFIPGPLKLFGCPLNAFPIKITEFGDLNAIMLLRISQELHGVDAHW